MSEAFNFTSSNSAKVSSSNKIPAVSQKTLEDLLKDLLEVQKSDDYRKTFKTTKTSDYSKS